MMIIRTALLVVLVALAIVFIIRWRGAAASQGVESATQSKHRPSLIQIAIGFVTDFFDTLGIGSFATTTTAYKLLHVVPDERMVGTKLVGHSLPVVVQAFIFLVVVQVDPAVLASLIAVSVLGSWMGAGVASRLPRKPIQIGIGIVNQKVRYFRRLLPRHVVEAFPHSPSPGTWRRMIFARRLCLSLPIALAVLASTGSAQTWNADQQELWKLEDLQWKMSAAKDASWIDKMVHPNLSYWDNDQVAPQNKASLVRWNRYNNGNSTVLEQELFPISMTITGNVAVAQYRYTVARENLKKEKETISGRYTDVFMKDGGQWKFIAWAGGEDPKK